MEKVRPWCGQPSTDRRRLKNRTEHYVSKKNDTDVAHSNVNEHLPISVIFGRVVAERVCYRVVICCLNSPNCVSALPGETRKRENPAPFKCCLNGLLEFSQSLLDFFNIADLVYSSYS